jgi:hypothetical protein
MFPMKAPKTLIAAALAMSAVGCTTLNDIKPGTPVTDVESKFGRPSTTCVLPNNERRMVWSQQPMGHYAWGTVVRADGQVGPMTQVLADNVFEKLGQGTWTPEQVACEFGPPMEIQKVGMPWDLQVVWSYRYRQNGVWYSLMYVFFGTDGKQVTKFFPGPDPMFMFDDNRFGDR